MRFKMDLPIRFRVIKDQKGLDKFYKKMQTDDKAEMPEGGCARSEHWKGPNGDHYGIVVFGKMPKALIAESAVHEAVHIKQYIMEHIEESKPSAEFEAYLIQSIFNEIIRQYHK